MTQIENSRTIQYAKPFTLSKPGEDLVIYWNVNYPGFANKDKLSIKIPKWYGLTKMEEEGKSSKSKLDKY